MEPMDTIIYPVILSVPESERARKGREKVRFLSRFARTALRLSCQKSGLPLGRLPKTDKGVPLPVNGVYWSLSHKSAVAGGVAAVRPVGLDLETLRPVNDGLLAKVGDDAEWRLASGSEQNTFFRFWTAKEAVLKAVGKGMAGLSRCRVAEIRDDTRMILTYDDARWPVEHCWFGGHVAAIATHDCHVSWTILP